MLNRDMLRRLLVALADESPAFHQEASARAQYPWWRLASALADSSPGFQLTANRDSYRGLPTTLQEPAIVQQTADGEPAALFERMRVRGRARSQLLHAAELRTVRAQDAAITATLVQSLGPVLQSLQSTRDAVIRIGAVLIVKVDWVVVVHQLTAAQQLEMDQHPELGASPYELLQTLGVKAHGDEARP